MKTLHKIQPYLFPLKNESGFLLVVTLGILVVLTVIGISATTTTRIELQIAGNDLIHKETFFHADSGAELAIALVEEGLGSPGGFTKLNTVGSQKVLDNPASPNNMVVVVDTTLAENGAIRTISNATDAGRDIGYFPNGYSEPNPNDAPHANIIVDGVTSFVAGSGLQMLAGYEGKGKGAAGGGGQILYTIFSRFFGRSQSQSQVQVQWRHIIGLELEGRY